MVHYTKTLGGKRKLESLNFDSSSGPKYSKDKHGNPFIQSEVTDEYETCLTKQNNLENMRSAIDFSKWSQFIFHKTMLLEFFT